MTLVVPRLPPDKPPGGGPPGQGGAWGPSVGWAPSYASVEQLRAFVRIGDDLDDELMTTALDAASRLIDHACDQRSGHIRQFGKTAEPETRYFTATVRGYGVSVRGQWVAETDDIVSEDPAGVTVAVYAGNRLWTPVDDIEVTPFNAAAYGHPGTGVLFAYSTVPVPPTEAGAVRVTTVWGWPAVPDTIEHACLLQSSRLLARREAPFGVAGSPETGTEVRLLAKLDPDVEAMVRPFAVKVGAVLA